MAKAGRDIVALVCKECKNQNYVTTRNKINIDKKLEVKKHCPRCGKHTTHKEKAKLK